MNVEELFKEHLFKIYSHNKRVRLHKYEYAKIISELLEAWQTSKTIPSSILSTKRYEILECGGMHKLIRKRCGNGNARYFDSIEETYIIIKRAHTATGHGGRDKMVQEISKRYANVTQ